MQGLAQGLSQNAALPLRAVNDVAKQLASTKVVAGFGLALASAAPVLAAPTMPPPMMQSIPAPPTLFDDKVLARFQSGLDRPAEALRRIAPDRPFEALPPLPAIDKRPPLAAGRNDRQAAPGPTTISITINPAPGMDERALAQLVADKIEEAKRRDERQARGRLSDFD